MMMKKIITTIKEWMLFSFYGVLILGIGFPLMYLFIEAWMFVFHDGISGSGFLSWGAVIKAIKQGTLAGFMLGSMGYAFTLVADYSYKSKAKN